MHPLAAGDVVKGMTTPGQPDFSPPFSPSGPLSGMPVTVQWIGLVAAVIAAGMGLRHLYIKITEPPQVVTVVELQRISESDPVTPSADEPWFDSPSAIPPEVAQPPAPAVITSTPTRPRMPANPDPVAAPTVVYLPVPVRRDPPEQIVREVAFVDSERTAPLEERLRSALGDPQELTADATAEETPSFTEDLASDSSGEDEPAPSGPPDSIGGVAVVSLRWNGHDLAADVREDSRFDVTLVTLGGLGSSHPTAGDRRGPARVVAQQHKSDASDAGPGIYYFHVFAGSTADSLDPDSHGLLGKDLHVVPSGEASPSEGPLATSDFVGAFDLSSVIALDPVWLPVGIERTQSDFVAAAGRKLYEVTIAGGPSEFDGWHEMQIGISHRFPDRQSREMVELQVLVRQNRFVVFGAPDVSRLGRASGGDASDVDTTLVAFTPLSSPEADSIRAMDSWFEGDPRAELIPIEGPSPVLPVELVSDPAALGDLRLRVLVLSNGEPLSVVAVETEVPRGEYLVEPVVSAVRQWRFHPPALDRTRLGAYFDITVGPEGEMTPHVVELASEPRQTNR